MTTGVEAVQRIADIERKLEQMQRDEERVWLAMKRMTVIIDRLDARRSWFSRLFG